MSISADPAVSATVAHRSLILRALRTRADEIQLARVLAALTREPEVARYLVAGILDKLAGGLARGLRATLPDDVYCVDEQMVTAPVGRQVLRRRSRTGRVDLDFRAPDGWRLLVELKINNRLTDVQVDRYTPVAPVVAVVRSIERSPQTTDDEHWVGAIEWQTLLPTLRSLPLPPAVTAQWLDLLLIVENDGDLAPVAARETAEDRRAYELLQGINRSFIETIARELQARHGTHASTFIDCISVTDVRLYRGRWTGFEVHVAAGDSKGLLVCVRLRNAFDRRPTLLVDWNPPRVRGRRHTRRIVNDAIGQLVTLADFQKRSDGTIRWEKAVDVDALDENVEAVTATLIRAGAFELEVANWQPDE